jgi:hypothetical protein
MRILFHSVLLSKDSYFLFETYSSGSVCDLYYSVFVLLNLVKVV